MSATEAVFIHSPQLDQYPYPPDCPFNTSRAGLARGMLSSMGLLAGADRRELVPEPADRDTLGRFHTTEYLDALRDAPDGHLGVEGLYMGLGTPDCPIFKGMYEYAALACGATLLGAGLILDGRARVAFNPSGGYHHAHAGACSGFCYINDVVLACMALAKGGMRVLFLDVDAHHGDGVQTAFYERNDVMTISLHESGRTLFPGTGFPDEIGSGPGEGYSVNVPMPAGVYDQAYLDAFEQVTVPLAEAFSPDAIVIELGMDALAGDPLTHLELTNNAHAAILKRMLAFDRPLLATGGGGYHIQNTARAWALAWAVMCGEDSSDEDALGLGGVMLASADWRGGLRDMVTVPHDDQRAAVGRAVEDAIKAVKANVFAIHGLSA